MEEGGDAKFDTALTTDLPIVPADLFEAARLAAQGKTVDISALILDKDKGSQSYRESTQHQLDRIAATIRSSEYQQFREDIRRELAGVGGQTFVVDLEGTLMYENGNRMQGSTERNYYTDPHMQIVLLQLMELGNKVVFWTSATDGLLSQMQQSMIPQLAALPAISIDSWKTIVKIYDSALRAELSDTDAVNALQKLYPGVNQEVFDQAKRLFDQRTTESLLAENDQDNYLRITKIPQAITTPSHSFFIDDNKKFIESATRRGWPPERAIKPSFDGREPEARNVVRAVKTAINK